VALDSAASRSVFGGHADDPQIATDLRGRLAHEGATLMRTDLADLRQP